jgi:TonB-dependent starch-binding outer membrane protein SusC
VADYFDKRSTDILLQLPIPANLGNVEAPFQNVGEVQNKGWELSLSYTHPLSPDASLEAGFNLSRVRNEVLDLGARGQTELGGWISGNTVVIEGQPIGAYWGYVADGFFQTQEEADNHATQFGNLGPGDIRFRDLNGDGVIDPENDRTIIGQPFPDYSFGFNLGGRYRSLTVSAFFQGVKGLDRFNWYNNELTGSSSFTRSVLGYWREDNPDATFPRFGNWANNNQMSTFWLDDASYLRLKHLQVGYTLPERFTQRLSFDHARLYVAGYNLLTFTSVEEYDPEKVASDERNFGYPGLKSFAIGIEVTL